MLSISQVAKSFAGRELFRNVSLQIRRGDRIGLVGPNGAGKSTLFGIVRGDLDPDAGSISWDKGVKVGFLAQENAEAGDVTVLETAMAITPGFLALQKAVTAHEPIGDSRTTADVLGDGDFSDHLARYESLGGFQVEPRARRILRGLAFRESDLQRPLRELSGGWVMRAHLARLLTQEPDLLLLDEPTNHLDLESLMWFQNHLAGYPGALLVISHDREFLNRIVTHIAEIRAARVTLFRGGYDAFLEQRAALVEQHRAAYLNQQRHIEQVEEFIRRFRAKNTKASQVQSRIKQLEKLERIPPPEPEGASVHFRFPQPARSGRAAISLRGVHHAYGDLVVYRGIDFEAERGQRVVLVGPNGAGKSTLLKLLGGVLPVQNGERILGHNVRCAYYAQNRAEMFDASRTVLEEAMSVRGAFSERETRSLLGCFLFRGDDVHKTVSVLSGGEKSRLGLVKTLLDPPNLLLMDEPTTHLDVQSIDALTAALEQFEGALIFISHDVYFIRKLAKQVLHVNAGTLTFYHGGYDYYLEKSGAGAARDGLTAPGGAGFSNAQPAEANTQRPVSPPDSAAARNNAGAGPKSREQKRREAEIRQARAAERRRAEQELTELEEAIVHSETRQAVLSAELEKPETHEDRFRAMKLNAELLEVARELEELNARWEVAAERQTAAADSG